MRLLVGGSEPPIPGLTLPGVRCMADVIVLRDAAAATQQARP